MRRAILVFSATLLAAAFGHLVHHYVLFSEQCVRMVLYVD